MNFAKAKTFATVVSTVMAGRTAIQRARQARDDGDRIEFLDAALNALVVITGILVIVRRMRRGEDEA